MPTITINFGRILILIGAIGYIYGLVATTYASPTALIPAFFGLILLVLGYIARAKENLRKHLMHAAVFSGIDRFFGFGRTACFKTR